MRTVYLLPWIGLFLLVANPFARAEELPPAARETVDAYEKEVAEMSQNAEETIRKLREKGITQLKGVLDEYCKKAMLDEALAIRDLIRKLQDDPRASDVKTIPAAGQEVLGALAREEGEVKQKLQNQVKKVRDKADTQLKILQDKFCKDAKLDEAVAIRDMRRMIQAGVTNAKPDPGYLRAQPTDIGKVRYFEVTGTDRDSTWGTDVYTTDSHLGVSAVHAGVLRVGQKGIVKVTILPGQDQYPSTTRNGVTSSGWGIWGVSFKVERVSDFFGPLPKK